MQTDKYMKVIITLIVMCTNVATADWPTFPFKVEDYYPADQKKIAREIELVARTHFRAIQEKNVDLIVSTAFNKEAAKEYWDHAFKIIKKEYGTETIDTDVIEMNWLGKYNAICYVRVLLIAKTVEPHTLEAQIWQFAKDKGNWVIYRNDAILLSVTEQIEETIEFLRIP